ncbi:MAG TPA: D-glycerate dehydrogenase [Burkholderiales bacterium]|nr:D-glycerate dehydrogenase [Burkholderiales bacterium]
MKVYVTQPVAERALERLRALAEVRVNPDPLHIVTKDELLAEVRTADVLFCLLHDTVDRDVIGANAQLRAIATMTITPANIDVAEATRRRIPVTVIPAPLLNDATADLAFALLLAVGRRVAEADRFVRRGAVLGSQSRYFEAAGVSGRVLGILGMGGVGRAMARRAAGFSMPVLYHDPLRLAPDEEAALGVRWVGFDEVLANADYVSLHVALTARTRHLIGAREFGLMRRSAYFINTARGAIVDEAALVAALAQGRIAGAGLDVYEHEPRIDPALRAMPNVVLTPHMGSAVSNLREAMANVVVDNILAIAAGRRPPNCWNPEVYATSKESA